MQLAKSKTKIKTKIKTKTLRVDPTTFPTLGAVTHLHGAQRGHVVGSTRKVRVFGKQLMVMDEHDIKQLLRSFAADDFCAPQCAYATVTKN